MVEKIGKQEYKQLALDVTLVKMTGEMTVPSSSYNLMRPPLRLDDSVMPLFPVLVCKLVANTHIVSPLWVSKLLSVLVLILIELFGL